jgi:hypothetical protein
MNSESRRVVNEQARSLVRESLAVQATFFWDRAIDTI